jgi:alanine racemase
MKESLLNRSWAEVNLDHIAQNVRKIQSTLKQGVEIMGVVKADAYGHGTWATVPVLIENGVSRLAVSMLDEAIELRKNRIAIPILVLSYTDPARAKEIIQHQITQTVYSDELAHALSQAACEMKREVRIHIKVDTGMGRVGFVTGYDAVKSILRISQMPNIVIEGIYTQFSCADEEETDYTEAQFEKFISVCGELERLGIQIPIKHVCNSAAALRFPSMHLDMVRVGILLYGMLPSGYADTSNDAFKPAMSLKTNVILVKTVEKGQPISYGRTFTTSRESIIATLPIGYADGYVRALSNRASVLIHGQDFPVVGSVCMDTCMVDVTDSNDEIRIGDEVLLFGAQGDHIIPIDSIADWMGTIHYEVACLIGKRIPRAYIHHGKLEQVQNYLLR